MSTVRKIDALLMTAAFLFAFFIYRLKKHIDIIAIQNSNLDYLWPPPCPSKKLEFSRFNELIAYAACKCQQDNHFSSGESTARLLCRENLHILPNLTIISILDDSDNDELKFEKFLLEKNRALRGAVIFMSSTMHDGDDNLRMNNQIDTTYFRSYKLDKDETVPNLIESFSDVLDEQDHINLLNIDVDSLSRSPESQIEILEGILHKKSDIIDQIFLIFTIRSNINISVLYAFYLFLYRLYFRYDFGIYSAKQKGSCTSSGQSPVDRRVQAYCVYKLTFRKIDFRTDYPVLAPTTGVGLPAEERERVESNLQKSMVSPLEENEQSEMCNLLYFGVKRVESLQVSCQKTLYFEPEYSDDRNRVLFYQHSARNVGYNLSEIVQNFPDYDGLFLNLKGFEFDVLEELFASRLVTKFSSITCIYHLWINEEGENYRKFYTQMIYMEKLGYKMKVVGNIDQCDKSLAAKDCYKVIWIMERP